MSERSVTVRLKMVARDYITGTTEAERATRRLAAAQRDMAREGRQSGDELERASRQVERAGWRTRRNMLYAAAGVAALGAAGGGLKLLPATLTAAGVTAGALPPLLMGAASAGGVLATSLRGVGKAAGEILKTGDPFAGLGRNARELVLEIKRLQPEMSGVRQGLQDRVLANGATNLHALATQVLPRVRNELNALAEDWGATFDQITAAAMDPRFAGAFNTAARGADWFFDLVNARIPVTVRSMSTLVTSADPLARAFGQSLVNALDRFNAAVYRADRSGALDRFFARGGRAASAFFDIVSGVGRLVGIVTREVAEQGGTLEDTAAALEQYLASGRGAEDMAGIVHTLTVSYEGLKDVLGPLGAIARDALADPATADALRVMFDVLAAGSEVLRIIFGLFQALPGPMQSVVLAGIALGVVLGKVTKAFGAMQAAAARAGDKLDKVGPAGQRAGRGLQAVTRWGGRAVGVLTGLQVAGAVGDAMADAATDVNQLAKSIAAFSRTGKPSGELIRVYGKNLEQLNDDLKVLKNGSLRDLEIASQIETLGGMLPVMRWVTDSMTNTLDRTKSLDAALADLARNGNTQAAAFQFQQIAMRAAELGIGADQLKQLFPQYTAVMQDTTDATGSMLERHTLLATDIRDAIPLVGTYTRAWALLNGAMLSSDEAALSALDALDRVKDSIKENGKAFEGNGRAALENRVAIGQFAAAAAEAAQKKYEETRSIESANIVYSGYIKQLRAVLDEAGLTDEQINRLISSYTEMPASVVTNVSAPGLDAATQGVQNFNFAIKNVPPSKEVPFWAHTDEARAAVEALKQKINELKDKHIYVTGSVRWTSSGDLKVPGGTLLKNRWGGVSAPYGRPIAAAMGLVRPAIYPPSDPPLYQFAEKETGGELFLPRRGIDRERGRALLAIAATWYDGLFVPMRAGGVRAAASGLVSVGAAPQSGGGVASRLDYAEAYIRARDAVASLNRALRENGKALSTATAKGRENLSAVYAAIRAAQDAARVKYQETGSVDAANKAYDEYINRLRATLKQQGINAAKIRELLALAERPAFGDSSRNVALARADIAAQAGLGTLADRLSLSRPGVDITTEHGRDNLSAILDFLELARAAAQALYEQSGSAKAAAATYNAYIAQLRDQLTKAGYPADLIDSLLNRYGRITLHRNARGGVYMAAAGGLGMLSEAAIYQQPMYGWAERGTGGELFLPRIGDRARGERLLAIGAGWYGGRYVPSGGDSGGHTTINNNLTVNALRADLTVAELRGLMWQMDIEARSGRRR